MPHRNHVARNPLLRKGGAHERARSSERREGRDNLQHLLDDWDDEKHRQTSMISQEMRRIIQNELNKIEVEHHVRILYACESGSRAWGFASEDSDYDVRFIYTHPQDWYLSVNLEDKRDVIEIPISDDLDINGWDLRKALQLFRKSNPPLLEWLGSPIIYKEQGQLARSLRQLSEDYFYINACRYHYLRMAENNYRGYLKNDEVHLKKYFYVLRPILAVNWIDSGYGVVPTEFAVLVNRVITDATLRRDIDTLVENKISGFESSVGPRITTISDYIEAELSRLKAERPDIAKPGMDIEPLNQLFQQTLTATWS